MTRWTPDPTFYPTALDAMRAPPETLAYVVLLGTDGVTRDAIGVVDTDPASSSYGELIERVDFPNAGNELHHLGWNACSSHLCPWASNAHAERRYLIVPGTALVPDSRARYRAGSASPRAGEGDRARGAGADRRVLGPAHGALRPRRHLPERPRQHRR